MLVGESNCLRSLYPYHHSQEARNFLMLVGQSNCLRTLYPQDRVCSWITFRRASQNFYDTVINGMVISPFTPTSHPCNSNLQAPSTNACGGRGPLPNATATVCNHQLKMASHPKSSAEGDDSVIVVELVSALLQNTTSCFGGRRSG